MIEHYRRDLSGVVFEKARRTDIGTVTEAQHMRQLQDPAMILNLNEGQE